MGGIYQPVSLVLEHLAALPASSLFASAALVAGRGVEKLVDYRQAAPMEFAAAAAGLQVDVDLGSSTSVSALFIPGSHNLSGTVTVKSGATQAGATTVRATDTASPGFSVLLTWAAASARWWRLEMTSSGAWQIPELVLGHFLTLERGVAPTFEAPYRSAAEIAEFASFETATIFGPARRRLELEFRSVQAGADLVAFDTLRAIGTTRPIVIMPPDGGAFWARLETDLGYQQSAANPAAVGTWYTARLALREQL